MSMGADFLGFGRKEDNVEKLETAVTDRERDHRLAFKLTDTTQIFVAIEQDELFEWEFSVPQDRLDLAPFQRRGTDDSNTLGARFSETHEVGGVATSCRQGWEKVVLQARRLRSCVSPFGRSSSRTLRSRRRLPESTAPL